MNFFSRFVGTFFDPGKTFKALAARPVWLDALVILLILVSLYTFLINPVAQKDSLRMMEDNAAKLKDKWGEEGYNRYLDRIKGGNRVLASFLLAPLTYLIGFLFSALIFLGIGRLTATQGNYVQVFSLLVHANFVDKFLGNALRLFLVSSRQSVFQTSTGLAALFPRLEVTSTLYGVLYQVDFFQLWLFGILGIGLASVFKISVRKALIISYGFWVLKSLLSLGLYLMQMRVFQ
jgi:hypothetical protein